ncbi:MAG: DUF2203 domain-containing protein [Deltaproteobacteria bacterium]|nr:DUF2203 domain-containing protein [Deltaproteobacteria bacterium]
MANFQSFPRLFTVAEARALLPTLRPLIEQVFQSLEEMKSKSEALIRREGLNPDSPDLQERLKADDTVARAIRRVEELVEEVNDLGCVCKGVEQGLVDFPCLLGEEVVFLCWQYGEEDVSHWHRIRDGFAGRRTLLDLDKEKETSYH